MSVLEQIKPYQKTIVAFVVGVLQFAALYFQLEDNGISAEDKVALINNVILALSGTAAVWAIPNKPKYDKE